MSIAPIANGDANARAKMNAAIAEANKVAGKAEQTALLYEVSERKVADGAESAARLAGLASEAQARDAALRALPLQTPAEHRPGDAPFAFGSSLLEGDPAEMRPLASDLVVFAENGLVARLAGAGIVAPRFYYPLEPGRLYAVEFVVQRRVNSPDPANDAVRCALAWYGQGRGRLAYGDASSVVRDLTALSSGSGRQVVRAVVSREAGAGVDFVAPAGARYCRPYVETFGLTPQSDVEIIRWADITETELYAPNVSAISARLYALESLGLGDRLNSVEAAVTAPDTLRFPTRSDAIAATVPLTVDVVETQGYQSVADGGGGVYRRAGTEPVHAGKLQSDDGAWWELVYQIGGHRVEQFGAVSALEDCTATINAAFAYLAAKGGGRALLGPRNYLCTGTLRRMRGGVFLDGVSPKDSKLTFDNGADECLVNKSLDGSQLNNLRTSQLQIIGIGKTSGHAIRREITAYDDVEDVIIQDPWNGILDYQINTNAWRRVTINGAYGTYAGKWDSPTTQNSSALTIEDSTIQGLYRGADGFIWDGWATTLRVRNVAILSTRLSFTIQNSRQSTSRYPAYGYISNLETDGAQINSVLIKAGADINFDGGDLKNTSGAPGQGGADTNCVEILPDEGYSYTHDINFTGTKMGNCRERAAFINALNVTFDGVVAHDASKSGANAFPTIEVFDKAKDVTLKGGAAGIVYGDVARASYGIIINAAAERTLVDGVNVLGNLTGGVLNGRPDDPDTVVRDCIGHRTRTSGKVTVPAGQTSVTVPHGLPETPRHAFASPEQILSAAAALYCTISGGDLIIGFGTAQTGDISISWTAGLYASS